MKRNTFFQFGGNTRCVHKRVWGNWKRSSELTIILYLKCSASVLRLRVHSSQPSKRFSRYLRHHQVKWFQSEQGQFNIRCFRNSVSAITILLIPKGFPFVELQHEILICSNSACGHYKALLQPRAQSRLDLSVCLLEIYWCTSTNTFFSSLLLLNSHPWK